ncbi:Outer membrane protein,Outer membrane protein (OmpH-like) [Chlamydia poikilotherma]|uniref:Outer membrane protein,Outer membrane protein (OmpH-like) n=1 Tax=Chlamydia poikilotherma TaxID=1967783 RepID=A0A3B0QGB7_9CHLA|nr:OmpH family outer membrane protein [Chlamydia poikilotherma]SYX08964.1 Outer membrane protein,Outer membrane protein (OmpH-like) [Chlamydia poikilotherma]
MKKSLRSVFLALLTLAGTQQVFADNDSLEGNLGVVSLKRCLEESAFGKKETEELENMKEQFSKNSEKMEEELTALYNKLQDEDYIESLSSSAADELRKKFENLSAEYNALQSQYYQMLNQSNMKRVQKLIQEVKKASEVVRVKEGLLAIFNDEVVLSIASSADKTNEIIKILDESFKNN